MEKETNERKGSNNTVYIPEKCRVTKPPPPKPATNPLQFVKVGPCPLNRKAQEQIKKVEEIKVTRQEVRDEAEDWQQNLDSWKTNRRKQQEHIIERVEVVKKLEQEGHDRNRRRTKTFNEMMGNRSGGKRFIPVYDDDSNDLSDYGIGSSSSKTNSIKDVDTDDNSSVLDEKDNNMFDSASNKDFSGSNQSQSEDETNVKPKSPSIETNNQKNEEPLKKSEIIHVIKKNPPSLHKYQPAHEIREYNLEYKSEIKTYKTELKDYKPEIKEYKPENKEYTYEGAIETYKLRTKIHESAKIPSDNKSRGTAEAETLVPKGNIGKRKQLFEINTSETNVSRRLSEDFANTQSIKERLQSLEKCVDVPLTSIDKNEFPLVTVKSRLQNFNKTNEADTKNNNNIKSNDIENNSKQKSIANYLLDKTSNYVNKPYNNEEFKHEFDRTSSPEADHLFINKLNSFNRDLDAYYPKHDNGMDDFSTNYPPSTSSTELMALSSDREDSGIHTADVSCSVSQSDEAFEDQDCGNMIPNCIETLTLNKAIIHAHKDEIKGKFLVQTTVDLLNSERENAMQAFKIKIEHSPLVEHIENTIRLPKIDETIQENGKNDLDYVDITLVSEFPFKPKLFKLQKKTVPESNHFESENGFSIESNHFVTENKAFITENQAFITENQAFITENKTFITEIKSFEQENKNIVPENEVFIPEINAFVPENNYFLSESQRKNSFSPELGKKPIIYENIEIKPVDDSSFPIDYISEDIFGIPARNLQPPSVKPPPPPPPIEDTIEVLKEIPVKRLNSTKRIKKELHIKRSSFLGLDEPTDDQIDPDFPVDKPPDINSFLQKESRLEKSLYKKMQGSRDGGLSESQDSGLEIERERLSSDTWNSSIADSSTPTHLRTDSEQANSFTSEEDEISKKEREIIELIEKEEKSRDYDPIKKTNYAPTIITNHKPQNSFDSNLGSQKYEQPYFPPAHYGNLEDQDSEVLKVEHELLQLEREELERQRENQLFREKLRQNRHSYENICDVEYTPFPENCNHRKSMPELQVPIDFNQKRNVPAYKPKVDDLQYRKSMPDIQHAYNRSVAEYRNPLPVSTAESSRTPVEHRKSMPELQQGIKRTSQPIMPGTPLKPLTKDQNERYVMLSPTELEAMHPKPVRNLTRNSIHALSAAPRSRHMPNDNWIQPKAKTEAKSYNQHWLCQEAELRRISEQKNAAAQSRHWPEKHIPDSVIHSLTQRVQSRGFVERNPAPRTLRPVEPPKDFPIQHPYLGHSQTLGHALPMSYPPQTGVDDAQDVILSVSGKKKCSYCGNELGRGAAMIIESLCLFYHMECFKCCVCRMQLGDGLMGTDVRVRNQKLHCHNCYSSDDGIKFSCV